MIENYKLAFELLCLVIGFATFIDSTQNPGKLQKFWMFVGAYLVISSSWELAQMLVQKVQA